MEIVLKDASASIKLKGNIFCYLLSSLQLSRTRGLAKQFRNYIRGHVSDSICYRTVREVADGFLNSGTDSVTLASSTLDVFKVIEDL